MKRLVIAALVLLAGSFAAFGQDAAAQEAFAAIRGELLRAIPLEDMIESMNGRPLLVAYWFRHDLERISERLHKLHIPFSKLDTEDSIRRWNRGELPVALIHPASAGHGLNLQSGGSTLVWFGLTWSLELYQQTNARLWRQGQQSGTVVIHHLVSAGTIDEDIMKVLEMKDKTQAAMMKAVKARVKE